VQKLPVKRSVKIFLSGEVVWGWEMGVLPRMTNFFLKDNAVLKRPKALKRAAAPQTDEVLQTAEGPQSDKVQTLFLSLPPAFERP
jgi:hypothetical protein